MLIGEIIKFAAKIKFYTRVVLLSHKLNYYNTEMVTREFILHFKLVTISFLDSTRRCPFPQIKVAQ